MAPSILEHELPGPNCFGCRAANGLFARLSAAKGSLSLCLPSVSPLSIQLPTGQAKPRTPSASVFRCLVLSLSLSARRGHERPLIVQSFPSPSYRSSTAVALSHPLVGGTRVRVSPEPELTSFPRPSFEQDNPTPDPDLDPAPRFWSTKPASTLKHNPTLPACSPTDNRHEFVPKQDLAAVGNLTAPCPSSGLWHARGDFGIRRDDFRLATRHTSPSVPSFGRSCIHLSTDISAVCPFSRLT